MAIFFNGKIHHQSELSLDFQDRAFMYGDGLFETMIVKEGKIRHLGLHLERLSQGMKTLAMEAPAEIHEQKLIAAINTLMGCNGYSTEARVKLQVWRKSGGLYTPQSNKVNTLITLTPFTKRSSIIHTAAIARTVTLHYSAFSALKTCNALPYIMAGIEKKARGLDEVILLDHCGNLSECSSSNLFWVKDKVLYTPALTTGCISGVARKYILQQAFLQNIAVQEVEASPETLTTADFVFCCNVTGLYFFNKIEDITYETSPTLALFDTLDPSFINIGVQ